MTNRTAPSTSLFLRAFGGMIAARQRQADRHVAAYLAGTHRLPVDFGEK